MAQKLIELSQTEIGEKGQELALKVQELYKLRADKKDAMNNFKSLIDRTEKEISELTLIVNTGRELRQETFFDDLEN